MPYGLSLPLLLFFTLLPDNQKFRKGEGDVRSGLWSGDLWIVSPVRSPVDPHSKGIYENLITVAMYSIV